MRECARCKGEGAVLAKPSNLALRAHRVAKDRAAHFGEPPPQYPPRRRLPCSECAGVGLVPGELPPLAEGGATVAVVGGGIGGAAVTLALRQRGAGAARVPGPPAG